MNLEDKKSFAQLLQNFSWFVRVHCLISVQCWSFLQFSSTLVNLRRDVDWPEKGRGLCAARTPFSMWFAAIATTTDTCLTLWGGRHKKRPTWTNGALSVLYPLVFARYMPNRTHICSDYQRRVTEERGLRTIYLYMYTRMLNVTRHTLLLHMPAATPTWNIYGCSTLHAVSRPKQEYTLYLYGV